MASIAKNIEHALPEAVCVLITLVLTERLTLLKYMRTITTISPQKRLITISIFRGGTQWDGSRAAEIDCAARVLIGYLPKMVLRPGFYLDV